MFAFFDLLLAFFDGFMPDSVKFYKSAINTYHIFLTVFVWKETLELLKVL